MGLCSASYLTREVDKNLSGGEVKRIEIATILARDPKLAIYDEPEADAPVAEHAAALDRAPQ